MPLFLYTPSYLYPYNHHNTAERIQSHSFPNTRRISRIAFLQRERREPLAMPCLFFDARSRETFGPRRHIDLAFYPGQPTLIPHPACNTFDPRLRRIAADCPLLFRRNASTLTPESLFISCLRTRPGARI